MSADPDQDRHALLAEAAAQGRAGQDHARMLGRLLAAACTSDPGPGPFTINPAGPFPTSVSIPYADGTNTLFTTVWTLTGARAADGGWSGVLRSDTSGGTTVSGYDYSTCNAVNVTRAWRAAWTGSNP